jgi:choline kinase
MTPETHPVFTGHSLSESETTLGLWGSQCDMEENFTTVAGDFIIPNNLLQVMEEKNIDAAIVHTASLHDEQPVLEAFNAGKNIVVVKRNPPTTIEENEMYKRLEKAGVATIEKTESTEGCLATALNRLSELIINKTNSVGATKI